MTKTVFSSCLAWYRALCPVLCVASCLVVSSTTAALATPSAGGPSVGSSGAHGALVVSAGQERVIDLAIEGEFQPDEWLVRFDYTQVQIEAGATVRFLNHPSRAPVAWIVAGDVLVGVGARVVLDGEPGSAGAGGYAEPGPGGFRGGRGAIVGSLDNASAGFGPGGALGDLTDAHSGGSGGSHRGPGVAGTDATLATVAPPYGHLELDWLAGGSGGGAGRRTATTQAAVSGGGAGGGALWIAADGAIVLHGALEARGGSAGAALPAGAAGGGGSGGALLLSSWTGVELGADAGLRVDGGAGGASADGESPGGGMGSAGRVRVECPGAETTGAGVVPSGASVGEPALPPATTAAPRLRVVSIGGLASPPDGSVSAGLGGPNGEPDLSLLTADPVDVVVEVENLPVGSEVWLRVTRAAGPAAVYGPQVIASGASSVTFTSIPLTIGVTAVQARATKAQP